MVVASLLSSKVICWSVLGWKNLASCWPSLAPATAQRPPEAEVNISDFERYILVQNGGSSGAGRLGVFAPRSAFGQSGGPGWLSRPPV